MQSYLTLNDISLNNKCFIVREDFNVPLQEGRVGNDTRIQRALPTLQRLLAAEGSSVIILSHLGRPNEKPEPACSLRPVATRLSQLLDKPVRFEEHWIEGIEIQPGEVVLCENVRFLKGEKSNDIHLAKKMAALGDVFVMDAFATAHRAQASTAGIAQWTKEAVAGPLLEAELQAIASIIKHPKPPVLAIVGGAKVSTKMEVLSHLLPLVSQLIVGGGIANTFLVAAGYAVGNSLYEPEMVEEAKRVLMLAKELNTEILYPLDVVVGTELSEVAKARLSPLDQIGLEDKIFDIGPQTVACYRRAIHDAKTILWNGPVGVAEYAPFAKGTEAIAHAVAESEGYSVAGGGDTIAAIDAFGVSSGIDYISTGGGAFLEMLEGKPLPGVVSLEAKQSLPASME